MSSNSFLDTVNRAIDKTHFKTFEHVWKPIKEQFPDITKKQLREILKKRPKDSKTNKKKERAYYIKIFSRHFDTWFHDLMDNGGRSTPAGNFVANGKDLPVRFWHIFIGTNNRFLVALPLASKSTEDVLPSIVKFCEKYRPIKLTSDNESSFKSKEVIDELTKRQVTVQVTSEHSSLAIIDRVIRTLRDMNTPKTNAKTDSHDIKYRHFTSKKMEKLVKLYNETFHTAIKMTPKEMFEDPEKEKEYIFKNLSKRDAQRSQKDFEIPIGTFVRYVLARSNGLTKKRYQLSKECYRIVKKDGNTYVLGSEDGSTINIPRFRLVSLGESKPSNIKFATSTQDAEKAIDKVIERDGKHYKVVYTDGETDSVPVSKAYGKFPQSVLRL